VTTESGNVAAHRKDVDVRSIPLDVRGDSFELDLQQTQDDEALIQFVPWATLRNNPFSLKSDGFMFFDEGKSAVDGKGIYSAEDETLRKFASQVNMAGLNFDGAGNLEGTYEEAARVFQDYSVKVMQKHEPRVELVWNKTPYGESMNPKNAPNMTEAILPMTDLLIVPTQPMLRVVKGKSTNGRFFPHIDYIRGQTTYELIQTWWGKSWHKYLRGHAEVQKNEEFMAESAALRERNSYSRKLLRQEHGEREGDKLWFKKIGPAEAEVFCKYFEIPGLRTVWVSLNDAHDPATNGQLAMCSASSLQREHLTTYEIFEKGLVAKGLNQVDSGQEWYAPESLTIGQGAYWDAITGLHMAIDRYETNMEDPLETAAPRISVECRTLLVLPKKAAAGGARK